MQRLVVELSLDDLARVAGTERLSEVLQLLEVVHYLRMGVEGFAGICRVRVRPGRKLEELSLGSTASKVRLEPLSIEGDSMIAYIEIAPMKYECSFFSALYFCAPPEIRGDMIRLTGLAESVDLRKFLNGFDEANVRYKICSLTDARFPPNTPISVLTDRQREILLEAYEHGYYDVPRRINSEELAVRMKIDKSTLVEHLRKAENRLVSEIVTTRWG